jgi:putative exosortase-associated protein (TIGR04073 family)
MKGGGQMGRKTVTLAVLFCVVLIGCSLAGTADNISRKADRGFSNTLGGWLELPYQTYTTAKAKGIFLGTPLGLGKGLVFMPLRMFSGITDLLTVPVPFPNGWKGLMHPEYNPWVEEPVQPVEAAPPAEQVEGEQAQ